MDETAHGGWRGGLRKRLVDGAFLSSSVAPVAKADDAKADAFVALVECARTADASANCLAYAGLTPLSRLLSVHGRRGSPS